MAQVLKNYEQDKSAWEGRRKAWNEDARMVNVVGGQWERAIADRRRDAGKPVLEFNEEHTFVQQVVNRCRQDRPQPKVTPGDDDATQESAEFFEGRLRHIQYASQADVAYDGAVDGGATGGFGFYRVECEYVDNNSRRGKPTFDQEPRIKRILDPMTQLPDSRCEEPDFSDAKRWFDRGWMSRDDFRAKFKGQEPISFDSDCDPEWVKEDDVCVARYWEVEENPRSWILLADGETEGWRDEISEQLGRDLTDDDVLNERDVPERTVWCNVIDGEKRLKRTRHLGQWIPIIPVLGRQVIVDGEHLLISVVRFCHGSQRLKNAYKSGVANLLAMASTAPWTGPRGMFKDKRWADANEENYATLEWEPVYDKNDQLIPAKPERNSFETPIQGLTAAAIAASDDLKRSVGYADDVLQPSRTNLSGVAVDRRNSQQSLNNFHFQDNLVRSQFHCARVVLDLDVALADTPRMLKARKEDGSTYSRPVHQAGEDDRLGYVPGQDPQKHIRLDIGRYDLAVISAPSYATKQEEERDLLLEILKADPQAWSLYRDVVFKLMGYADLEERAKLALAPQILQAMQAGEQGIPPQVVALMTQLQQQKQQLSQVVQKLITVLQSKQVEAQGKLDVERLKLIRELMVIDAKNSHDAAGMMLETQTGAVQHMMDMLHESEMAPDPAAAPPNAPPGQGVPQ